MTVPLMSWTHMLGPKQIMLFNIQNIALILTIHVNSSPKYIHVHVLLINMSILFNEKQNSSCFVALIFLESFFVLFCNDLFSHGILFIILDRVIRFLVFLIFMLV